MSLKDGITTDMKNAMRSGEKGRLGLIRLLLAAVKQREVDERIVLDDAQVLSVIEKMVKQRKESITQFQQGGREDLAATESREIDWLTGYLPAQLGAEELAAIIALENGKTFVEAQVKAKAAGRADMGAVGALIKARLGG